MKKYTNSLSLKEISKFIFATIFLQLLFFYGCKDSNAQKSDKEKELSISAASSKPYYWPKYSPGVSYNFRDEYPDLLPPTKVLDDCPNVEKTFTGKWWCFRMGKNANPLISERAIKEMLDYFDSEFTYFRDTMGWPMDIRARNGYYSSIYLFGSGLCTDDEPNTALGGWMGSINYKDKEWPMVLASYYPVVSFDPINSYPDAQFQRGGMIHEGIHAMIADYDGVKNSAWFHEGGNVWFQQTADSKRSGVYDSFGFLNASDVVAPFIPIESYSGWLLDGSFGGPSAEGVEKFSGDQQICTWRSLLGGKQYSSMFPTFVSLILGDKSVPWIWRNAKNRVLEGLAEGIGADAMRRLIVEYRAKQATLDWGHWRNAYRKLLDDNFGQEIKEDWKPSSQSVDTWKITPYVKTVNNNGILTPEKTTLPGWSGANQIPLKVVDGSQKIAIDFVPLSTNMTCQIVYRSVDDDIVYSQYSSKGICALDLVKKPANNTVIVVVTNNDYLYEGEITRKKKHDYRIRLVKDIVASADIYTPWYHYSSLVL